VIFGGQDIGIDLGTATILVYVKGKGIVLREPSVVAIDKNTNQVLAVGQEARKMLGRTPGNIVALRPLKDGVISDYTITEKMLKYFINKVCGKFVFAPKIMICVPSRVTEVERKAVIDAASHAGARKVYLIEEPIAAAIGAGLDITKPYGSMIVDIGGGTSDIAVISLGGSVKSTSIKMAGDKFDEAIIRYIKKTRNVMLGERTAEDIKINIGCMYPKSVVERMTVKGRNITTGLPVEIEVSTEDTYAALQECAEKILDGVHQVLEETPPELVADVSERGIYITGGGGLVWGLDKLIAEKTGIPVMIAEDAQSCVAVGTGKALEHVELFESGNAIKIRKY
jgi:rod shape-determining protein MreB